MAPTLYLGGLALPAYTVLIVIGFTAGLFVAEGRRSLQQLPADVVLAAYLIAGVCSFLGGKLFFIVQGWGLFLERAAEGMSFFEFFSRAGLVFYGGMAGALGGIFLAAALLRTPAWPLMDTLLPSLPLAQAFGRVGCLLAGCCYGLPVSWGVWMHPDSGAPTDTALLPVQLFEAAGALVLFFVVMRAGRRQLPQGRLLSIYLLGYGALRFVLEFFRYDSIRGFAGALSVSQWCSLVSLGAGSLLLWWSRRQPVAAADLPVSSLQDGRMHLR